MVCRRQNRWSAPARRSNNAAARQLFLQGLQIALFQFQMRGGIEILTNRIFLTERNVDVDASHFL